MNRVRQVTVSPTVALTAYTANDVVGGLLTFNFTDAHPFDGVIRSVLVTDAANQKEQYVLYVFNAVPSTIADDAAFAPVIADLKKMVTTVTVATADYTTANSLAWACLGGHEDTKMEVPVHSDTGSLYVYAVATDTPDYAAATDLVLTMTVELW